MASQDNIRYMVSRCHRKIIRISTSYCCGLLGKGIRTKQLLTTLGGVELSTTMDRRSTSRDRGRRHDDGHHSRHLKRKEDEESHRTSTVNHSRRRSSRSRSPSSRLPDSTRRRSIPRSRSPKRRRSLTPSHSGHGDRHRHKTSRSHSRERERHRDRHEADRGRGRTRSRSFSGASSTSPDRKHRKHKKDKHRKRSSRSRERKQKKQGRKEKVRCPYRLCVLLLIPSARKSMAYHTHYSGEDMGLYPRSSAHCFFPL
jgi:hypothetical protein